MYKASGKFIGTRNAWKMLRSKSEAIIDRMLYQNKIPFHYEEKLVLDGIILYPDFVIRHLYGTIFLLGALWDDG